MVKAALDDHRAEPPIEGRQIDGAGFREDVQLRSSSFDDPLQARLEEVKSIKTPGVADL
jgi:hypothetical protein